MHAPSQSLMSAYPNNDPHWNYVSAYLRGNQPIDALGRFRDNTGKRYWSTGGLISLDTVRHKYGGGSLQFPGNNGASEIGTGDSEEFNLAGKDFTMELWFNASLWPGGTWYPGLISQRTSTSSNHSFTWFCGVPGTGGLGLHFAYTVNGSTNFSTGLHSYAFALDTWYHVAVSRIGPTIYQYVNGVSIGSHNIGTSVIYNSSQIVKLGCIDGGIGSAFTTSYFFGWMSDIRITNGVCRYPNGTSFTPPLGSFPDK